MQQRDIDHPPFHISLCDTQLLFVRSERSCMMLRMIEIDQFHWILARVFYGATCALAVFGISCNFVLLATTVQASKLRSTCNILIAICAIADIFHQLGTLVQLPMLFGYLIEMDSDLCLIIMYLPQMGVATGVAAMFAIGLDRMCSVIASVWHQSLNKRVFHYVLVLIIFGHCAAFIFLNVAFYEKRVVICGMLSAYPDGAIASLRVINLVANGATALVYSITWFGMQAHKGECENHISNEQYIDLDAPAMKRIMKSLFLIAAADVLGWIITPAFIGLIQHFNLNSNQMFAWAYFGTIFINAAMAFKLLIYYSSSTEYRHAIDAFLASYSE